MLALVAVLLANADGRSGIYLSRLLSVRADRRVTVVIAFGAFIINAVVAAVAGAIATLETPEIAAEELRMALKALDFLVGAADVEAVLDVIFGRFCIGK